MVFSTHNEAQSRSIQHNEIEKKGAINEIAEFEIDEARQYAAASVVTNLQSMPQVQGSPFSTAITRDVTCSILIAVLISMLPTAVLAHKKRNIIPIDLSTFLHLHTHHLDDLRVVDFLHS